MDKKEKIFIGAITLVILVAIFFAFLISNSQKLPPELNIQNADKKVVMAELGEYSWKVYGHKTITDSLDLKTFEYPSDKTIVSKTSDLLNLSTTEKFTIQDITYFSTNSNEAFSVNYNFDEAANYFTIYSPDLEGTYICLVKLNFYTKGFATYGFKLVVTDENIYDVDDIFKYKNTNVSDISRIKEILNLLPYSKNISGIIIDAGNENKTLTITYENDLLNEKEDLLNNTIALFALIPELDSISYEKARTDLTSKEKDFYYSRDEINSLIGRDANEYAEDSELWKKEIIYKEKESPNSDITLYSSLVSTALSKISEKDIGNYIAVDFWENNTSGEINLSKYDLEKVLKGLKNEQAYWINLESGDTAHNKGTLIKVVANKAEEENEFIFNVTLITSKNEKIEATYRALKDAKAVTIKEGIEPFVNIYSGENEVVSGEIN